MNHDQKLAFIAGMTDKALQHAATTPNVPHPDGKMSHEKMLSFVTSMASKGIQHLDQGGTLLNGPTNPAAPGTTTTQGWNGSVGNFLGTNNQFQAQGVPVQAGTNTDQLNNAYTGATNAIGTQAGVTGVLNNGLNQGAGAQSQLSLMYADQARGGGPNPALARLNQATGNNIAQQAALAAGQRGAGANAGLIARQNAQTGAAIQQQAVGQGAVQEAQQQLAAEQNLQNLSASQIGQGSAATQGLNNAQQNEQNILQGANTAYNNAGISQQSNLNNVNAQVAVGNQKSAGNTISGIGSALSTLPVLATLFAEGGTVGKKQMSPRSMPVQKMDEGGAIVGAPTSGPQSYIGQWLNSNVATQGPSIAPMTSLDTDMKNPFDSFKAPSMPGQKSQLEGFDAKTATPLGEAGQTDMPALAEVGTMFGYDGGLMKSGGKVKAQSSSEKAVKKGDSLANDKIPAMLSQGELVIDRETMADPGPMGQMARALAQHISKRNKKK